MGVPLLQTRQSTCDKYPANPAQITFSQQSAVIGLAVSLGVSTTEGAKPYVFSGRVDPGAPIQCVLSYLHATFLT